MRVHIAVFVALTAIACGLPAFAQQAGAAPEKMEFRKWDVDGSIGILGTTPRDFAGPFAGGRVGYLFAWNFDAGRYFTPHVKAEVGLMRTNERSVWESVSAPPGQYAYRERRVHPTAVSTALTYQFLENAFAHPYVSAGIRITSISEEIETFIYPTTFPPPSVSTAARFAEVRPFVAAGYKSYFNERAYMKSDVLIAFDTKGVSHGTLRIGFGFDF